MMLQPSSLGDWADPSCEPGTPGCVPHWYCYIPLMATPDCLSSFAEGTKEIVGGTANAAGGVVGSAVKGVVTGAVDAVTGGPGGGPTAAGIGTGVLLLGAAGIGLLFYLGGRR